MTGSSFFLGLCLLEVTPSDKTCTAKISGLTVGAAAKTFSLISFSSRTMQPLLLLFLKDEHALVSQHKNIQYVHSVKA